MGFLNLVNIFSSAYDDIWRNFDVYDVIVTSLKGKGMVNFTSVWVLHNLSHSCQLHVTVVFVNFCKSYKQILTLQTWIAMKHARNAEKYNCF